MFRNVGDKLKKIAIIFFVLTVIGGIVIGILLVSKSKADYMSILIVSACGIGGALGGYLLALPVYAFGVLVESSRRTEENTAKLVRFENLRMAESDPAGFEEKQKRNQSEQDPASIYHDDRGTPSFPEPAGKEKTEAESKQTEPDKEKRSFFRWLVPNEDADAEENA